MNKQWKLLIGTLLSLLMYSCSVVDEEQNDVVNIKDASELYGTWEYESSSLITGYLGDNTTPYYYVLKENGRAYHISHGEFRDSAIFAVLQGNWAVSDSQSISINPNISVISDFSFFADYEFTYTKQVDGIKHVSISTFSNLDSIILLDSIIGENAYLYDEDESIDSILYTVIQFTGDRMSLVKNTCYNLHKDAKSMKDVCRIYDYKKVRGLTVDSIILQVDTVSSTDLWRSKGLLYE